MKRKPTSYGDMLKAVAHVKHPGLRDVDRHFLLALATDASEKGVGVRRGRDTLGDRIGRSGETVRKTVRRLEQLGLLETTHKGHGPNNSNVYRLCLENPAYPDDYPGLKNRTSSTLRISDEKAQADDPKCASSPEQMRKPDEANAQGDDPKCASSTLRPSYSSNQSLQPKITTTTTTTDTDSGESVKGRKPPLWLSLLWSLAINELEAEARDNRQAELVFRKAKNGESKDTTEIEALVEKEGGTWNEEIMVAIAWAAFCLKQPNPHINKDTLYPVSVFLGQVDTWMQAARTEFHFYTQEKQAWKEKSKLPYPAYSFPSCRLVFENCKKEIFTRYIGREQREGVPQ